MTPTKTDTIHYYFSRNSWQMVLLALSDFLKNAPLGAINQNDLEIREFVDNILGFFAITDRGEMDVNHIRAIVSLLDVSLLKKYSANPNDQVIAEELYEQLNLLNASFGLLSGVKELTSGEIFVALSDPKIFDEERVRFYYSCRTAIKGQDIRKYSAMIMPLLAVDEFALEEQFIWSEVLMYSLLLQIVWLNFSNFEIGDQEVLLQKYFYKAIIAGVSVRQILTNLIMSAEDVYMYTIWHSFMIQALEKNKESVVIGKPEDNLVRDFFGLITSYRTRVGEKFLNGLEQKNYITALYEGRDKKEHLVMWLMEAFYIYLNIKTGNLVPYERYSGQKNDQETEIYINEFAKLYEWFFFEADWDKIVLYYQKPEFRVPLVAFLRGCHDVFDLESETAVERITKFSEFLHQNGLLPKDQDVLEFHESDGRFHWNEKIV